MSIDKYAYLLDKDNYMVENKIFIDLMWYIARNKDNGPNKPKGMVTKDKNNKIILSVKSHAIRNAGIMFQQLFYWHFNAIKQNKATKYKYNDNGILRNVVKKDYEDWWDELRLTDNEVTTANKFLIDADLIEIHKMRIKAKDKEVFKPSNCYLLKESKVEEYLESIVDISKAIYKEKVDDVRTNTIKRVKASKIKKSTALSTNISVTPVKGETLKNKDCNNDINNLSTLSTGKVKIKYSVTPFKGVTKVTLVKGVTKDTLLKRVTKDTPFKGVTNKSDTTYSDTTYSDTTYSDKKEIPSIRDSWDEVSKILKLKLPEIQYKTWIKESIKNVEVDELYAKLEVYNDFTKEILETRYRDDISEAFKLVLGLNIKPKFIVINN
ncbi:DnaA N-terminal domain-containing protein [Clostridium omnivorum]|uniref:DnaA N-terminal domain-containing protein n=1 Tax=Clostridium omnivorum TaxID=1604902 RepID=A0ABQ5NCG0_9CLOT|nr:DnaA N-terminal domain-containing protein [Clostridium sp. E14]GLC32882.1 hypothetical protein bsdE14_42920 [Clostridium sp. E14]